jgi:hypothetical protein
MPWLAVSTQQSAISTQQSVLSNQYLNSRAGVFKLAQIRVYPRSSAVSFCLSRSRAINYFFPGCTTHRLKTVSTLENFLHPLGGAGLQPAVPASNPSGFSR